MFGRAARLVSSRALHGFLKRLKDSSCPRTHVLIGQPLDSTSNEGWTVAVELKRQLSGVFGWRSANVTHAKFCPRADLEYRVALVHGDHPVAPGEDLGPILPGTRRTAGRRMPHLRARAHSCRGRYCARVPSAQTATCHHALRRCPGRSQLPRRSGWCGPSPNDKHDYRQLFATGETGDER
jgi:hypothetical protein